MGAAFIVKNHLELYVATKLHDWALSTRTKLVAIFLALFISLIGVKVKIYTDSLYAIQVINKSRLE